MDRVRSAACGTLASPSLAVPASAAVVHDSGVSDVPGPVLLVSEAEGRPPGPFATFADVPLTSAAVTGSRGRARSQSISSRRPAEASPPRRRRA